MNLQFDLSASTSIQGFVLLLMFLFVCLFVCVCVCGGGGGVYVCVRALNRLYSAMFASSTVGESSPRCDLHG